MGVLTDLRDAAYETAREKGWYDPEPDFQSMAEKACHPFEGPMGPKLVALLRQAYELGQKVRTPGDAIALMHSELSEALEDLRAHRPLVEHIYEHPVTGRVLEAGDSWLACEEGRKLDGVLAKPAGVPSELADVIIRILDFSGYHGIDIERAVREKMAFNRTRKVRHGNKAF